MSEPKDWEDINKSITDNLLSKITESLECSVCSEIMHVPVISTCGHSFCYDCCTSWFDNKVTCPTCRHELQSEPTLNVQLKDISNNVVDILIDHGDEDEKKQLIKRREESNNIYQHDLKTDKLYGGVFQNAFTILDRSDGVARCGNCHWEANGSECLHCGARFRNVADDEFSDADGYSIQEDHDEIRLYGAEEDAYDTDDSFIDGRQINDINEDLHSDDNDILSSDMDAASARSWQGFEVDNNTFDVVDSDAEEVSHGYEDSDHQYHDFDESHDHNRSDDYSDDDLHTAIDNFHHSPIDLDIDEDGDEEIDPRRRRQIIISDDD